MEWIPRGLPSLHAPIPVCGKTFTLDDMEEWGCCALYIFLSLGLCS